MADLFNENMSSKEATAVLWDYCIARRGKNCEDVKNQYHKTMHSIIKREMSENRKCRTKP